MTLNLFFDKRVLVTLLLFYWGISLNAFNVDAGEDQIICNGNVASMEIGGSPTASGSSAPTYVYSWNHEETLSCSDCPNPIASPTETTIYTVTVTDGGGFVCTDEVEVAVLTMVVHPQNSDFVSGKEGRVLISTFQDASYYTVTPSAIGNLPAQHEGLEVPYSPPLSDGKCNRVKITAHLNPGAINKTVYFRLVYPDPDDPSPYEKAGTSNLPDLNGGDNKDTNIKHGPKYRTKVP